MLKKFIFKNFLAFNNLPAVVVPRPVFKAKILIFLTDIFSNFLSKLNLNPFKWCVPLIPCL